MFKMLIVDDEEYITDSLYYYFMEHEYLNIEIYKCYSAVRAKELINSIRFDLVLSDISMPCMDGLTLLKEIKLLRPLCRVIFFTGYKEFDYVYEAMKYENVQYLLKTESYEDILKVVETTLKEIESQYEREVVEEWLKDHNDTDRELQNSIINGLFNKLDAQATQDLSLKNYTFGEDGLLLLAGHNTLLQSQDVERISVKRYIDNFLALNLASIQAQWIGSDIENQLCWIFQSSQSDIVERIKENIEAVLLLLQDKLNIKLNFVLAMSKYPEGQLGEVYSGMSNFLDRSQGENILYMFGDEMQPSSTRSAVKMVMDFVKNNYMHDISLTDVANAMFLNASYISWFFKKETGINFQKHLTKVRLNHACSELQYTNKKIATIAVESGFGSAKYFTSVFKKNIGSTPIEYREKNLP